MKCANPTCDRQVWQLSGQGRVRAFCSRDCQVATLRNGGMFFIRVPVPATLAHQLASEAAEEKMSVEDYVLMLIKEGME